MCLGYQTSTIIETRQYKYIFYTFSIKQRKKDGERDKEGKGRRGGESGERERESEIEGER